jgi:hypothetical protein
VSTNHSFNGILIYLIAIKRRYCCYVRTFKHYFSSANKKTPGADWFAGGLDVFWNLLITQRNARQNRPAFSGPWMVLKI